MILVSRFYKLHVYTSLSLSLLQACVDKRDVPTVCCKWSLVVVIAVSVAVLLYCQYTSTDHNHITFTHSPCSHYWDDRRTFVISASSGRERKQGNCNYSAYMQLTTLTQPILPILSSVVMWKNGYLFFPELILDDNLFHICIFRLKTLIMFYAKPEI